MLYRPVVSAIDGSSATSGFVLRGVLGAGIAHKPGAGGSCSSGTGARSKKGHDAAGSAEGGGRKNKGRGSVAWVAGLGWPFCVFAVKIVLTARWRTRTSCADASMNALRS